uniref:transforming growth factor beta regulator 1 isoform X3 n=1 Tax=Myxine glutinosa TaxID=7769 RepID=UPI00358FAC58
MNLPIDYETLMMKKSPMIHGKEQTRPPMLHMAPVSNVSPGGGSLSPLDPSLPPISSLDTSVGEDMTDTFSLFPGLETVVVGGQDHLESDPPETPEKQHMTWLNAAQLVLEDARRPLHIKEIKQRVIQRGLVQSSSKSSLEAVMYRETLDEKQQQRLHHMYPSASPPNTGSTPKSISPRGVAGVLSRSNVGSTKGKVRRGTRRGVRSIRFHERYRRLRRLARATIFQNAALCDELAHTQDKLIRAKEERLFLAKCLLQYEAVYKDGPWQVAGGMAGAGGASASTGSVAGVGSEVPNPGSPSLASPSNILPTGVDDLSGKRIRRGKEEERGWCEASKGKSSRRRRVAEGPTHRLLQPIPLDPAGRPIFPIILGSLTVYSLGEIIPDRPAFHDTHHIFPVGFCSTRTLPSAHPGLPQALYTCQIKDGGQGPQFEIVPEDTPQNPFVASSAAACLASLLRSLHSSRGKTLPGVTTVGADFFGFSHPTIQHLIQSCPGARKCTGYTWLRFEVCRPMEMPAPQSQDEDVTNSGLSGLQPLQSLSGTTLEQTAPSSSLISVDDSGPSLRSLLTSPLHTAPTVSSKDSPQNFLLFPPSPQHHITSQ